MAIKTPTINKIIRMNEFDLLRTSIVPGNMYMCLDTQKLYYDETNSKRVAYFYTSVKTINDLLYNITPSSGTTYYCWEDNSLWLWMNKWIALYSTTTYPSAYVYDSNRNLNEVYRYDQPNIPADDNGLLKDGSVVIRDRNRIIKGKVYINDTNDNMTISSFLGGGIRFLPNGKMDTAGELLISDEGDSFIRSTFSTKNNEMYVDYTEDPESDTNEYANSTHRYQVFHEGNLDVSAIKILTPEDIYNKLLDKSLPSPLQLNVAKLNGRSGEEYTLLGHKHKAVDITDFNETARSQSEIKIREIFNTMVGEGIDVSFDSASSTFTMSANTFEITFDGGITGSAKVNHLGNTIANVVVNPSRHIHQNYIDTMNDLQDQIDGISSIDPTNFYNKEQVNNLISDVSGTDVPTSGKPLLVNNNLILPGTSESTNKLKEAVSIKLTGDILGEVLTDLSSEAIIITNADNIISNIAEPGKALKIDAQGNLPANSISASKLNHNININLEGEVVGNVELDTSLETATINTTLVPGDNILQSKDLGVSIATLDENGKVPTSQLPASQAGLVPMGLWNPESGAPSENPVEGYFWVCDTDGSFNEHNYQVDDWCLWYNSAWHHINTEANVMSVNGKEGTVVLNASDVGAISKDYITYNVGETIPANKLVMTSLNGIIEGASVTSLSKTFGLETDETGDVIVSSDSLNATDGSTNLDVKLQLTENAYNTIFERTGYVIQGNGIDMPYQNKINFLEGFNVLSTDEGIEISVGTINDTIALVYWNGLQDLAFFEQLTLLYNQRNTKPIILVTSYDKNIFYYLIDSNYPDITATTTLLINPDHYIIEVDDTNISNIEVYRKLDKLSITFQYTDELTMISEVKITSDKETLFNTLTTQGVETTEAYIPLYDSNPATKKYVDQSINFYGKYVTAIGDGTNTSFTIKHNLNSTDILVVLRDSTSGEQIFASNTVVDANTLKIDLDTVITDNALSVVITKL